MTTRIANVLDIVPNYSSIERIHLDNYNDGQAIAPCLFGLYNNEYTVVDPDAIPTVYRHQDGTKHDVIVKYLELPDIESDSSTGLLSLVHATQYETIELELTNEELALVEGIATPEGGTRFTDIAYYLVAKTPSFYVYKETFVPGTRFI